MSEHELDDLNKHIQELETLRNKKEEELRKQRVENLLVSGFYSNATWEAEYSDDRFSLRYCGKFPANVWEDLTDGGYTSWVEIYPKIILNKVEDDFYYTTYYYLCGSLDVLEEFVKKFSLFINFDSFKFHIEDLEKELSVCKNILERYKND